MLTRNFGIEIEFTGITRERAARIRYCKALDQRLVERMKNKKPTTFKEIEDIWYEGYLKY